MLVALCFVVFWGTFFPLIAEAVTGRQRNIGPPVYERFVVPLALILVLLAGIGPLIAWRRATAANLRAQPRAAGAGRRCVVLVGAGRARRDAVVDRAADVRARRRSWSAAIVQELWRGVRARRAVAREAVPVALVSLVKRNRRRYGGYLVHVGIVVLFVGVAASSSFKDVRDVALQPGPDREGRRLRVHLRQADRRAARGVQRAAGADRARRAAERAQARRQGEAAAHVQGLLPVAGLDARARSRASSTASRRPRSALDASLRKDVWAAVAPDIVKLQPRIDEGDKVFAKAADDLTPEQSNEFLALALRGPDRPLRGEPAARALPLRGQPDGDLDLDRRR